MKDMRWGIVQKERSGVANVGSGEDDGQGEEVKSPAGHAELHKGLALELSDDVFEEFIREIDKFWSIGGLHRVRCK